MDTVGSPRFLAYLSDVSLEPEQIKTVMINEAVPLDPVEDFYGSALAPAYLETVFPLFREAGCEISRIEELLHMGIYLTNAVKFPKRDTTVPKELLEESLPVLEMELGCLLYTSPSFSPQCMRVKSSQAVSSSFISAG